MKRKFTYDKDRVLFEEMIDRIRIDDFRENYSHISLTPYSPHNSIISLNYRVRFVTSLLEHNLRWSVAFELCTSAENYNWSANEKSAKNYDWARTEKNNEQFVGIIIDDFKSDFFRNVSNVTLYRDSDGHQFHHAIDFKIDEFFNEDYDDCYYLKLYWYNNLTYEFKRIRHLFGDVDFLDKDIFQYIKPKDLEEINK